MKNTIQQFMDDKKVAIAGVSRDSKKFGNSLMKALGRKGYEVFPVNPHASEIEGRKCYNKVADLPDDVQNIIIATRPEYTSGLVKDCKSAGLKRVWMQRGAGKGSATPEAIEYCRKNGLEYVYGVCPLMYFESGLHHFHFWIRKTFGRLPHELLN